MAILSEIEKTGLDLRTLCGYMGVTSDALARHLEVAPVAMLAYYRGLRRCPPKILYATRFLALHAWSTKKGVPPVNITTL